MTNTCLACGNFQHFQVLDFGLQPAANLLGETPGEAVRRETLALHYCDACGHAQQAFFYPAEDLFGHYLYQSGTSGTLRDYFGWLAQGIAERLPKDATVLELASNDGSFLEALQQQGVVAEGIEPARNLARLCSERGLSVTCGFWPDTTPSKRHERVVAMNVLAHTPEPLEFLSAVRAALMPGGVAYIQVSQVDMFENFEFDTLYHEHYSFFCPSSMWSLARRAGFTAGQFLKTAIHGGSMIAVLGDSNSGVDDAASGLKNAPFYLAILGSDQRPTQIAAEAFGDYARTTCMTVRNIADLAHDGGRTVVLVGAAAKAITVLQASGMAPDRIVDEAPLKIGRYVPGTELKIEALSAVKDIPGRALFVIGAWNFAAELRSKLRALREPGDLTAVYFPQFSIEPL